MLKFILSRSNNIQQNEVDQLKRLPAFSEEGAAKENGTRFKISELYEPSDVFRTLGLPILDWRGKDGKIVWRGSSNEGMPGAV